MVLRLYFMAASCAKQGTYYCYFHLMNELTHLIYIKRKKNTYFMYTIYLHMIKKKTYI